MRLLPVLLLLVAACDRQSSPRPGLQDHGAHHGGVVFNGPRLNLETAVTPDGVVRVYVTDEWRRPVSLDGVLGTATLTGPGGRQAIPLAVEDDALVGQGPALSGDTVGVDVAVDRNGEMLRMAFIVPLVDGAPGAAGVPLDGCVPPPPGDDPSAPRPRCVLPFLQAIHGVVAPRDGSAAVVSVLESRTTSWQLPSMRLLAGFDPPPPEEIPVDSHPHIEEPTAMAMRADGQEVVLAIGEHLLRHDVRSGRLLAELAGPGAAPRSVAWSPVGRLLLVNVFASGTVYLLDAETNATVRTFEAPGETTVVAFSPDGTLAAVGTEAGPIVLFDVAGAKPPRTLSEPTNRTDALAFAGDRLVASGADGTLRVWDPATGSLVSSTAVGVPIVRLAVRADGAVAATGDREGHIRLHSMPDGAVAKTLTWHRGFVRTLAFAGPLLLAGDADRQLALWDVS